MQTPSIETFYPANRKEWRQWLKANHQTKKSVWLEMYKKDANIPTISWNEAVEEALCFGWIDSTRRPVDDKKFIQFFSKRKPNSTWSKVNKLKIEELITRKKMAKAGLATIEAAKQNGSWSTLDVVEELIIPNDLEAAFKKRKGAKDFYLGLNKSIKKQILLWLVMAKRPETRQKRIEEVVFLAAQKQKPKHIV